MKRRLILLFLILLLPFILMTSAQTSQIEIYITEAEVQKPDRFEEPNNHTLYEFSANITVVNNDDQTVKYSHSDLCEFKLIIQTDLDKVNRYDPICAEATKVVEFDPGNNNDTAFGLVTVEGINSSIPDGEYNLSVEVDDNAKSHNAIVEVRNGEVVDIQTNAVPEDNSFGVLNFNFYSLIPLLFISYVFLLKPLVDRSNNKK